MSRGMVNHHEKKKLFLCGENVLEPVPSIKAKLIADTNEKQSLNRCFNGLGREP